MINFLFISLSRQGFCSQKQKLTECRNLDIPRGIRRVDCRGPEGAWTDVVRLDSECFFFSFLSPFFFSFFLLFHRDKKINTQKKKKRFFLFAMSRENDQSKVFKRDVFIFNFTVERERGNKMNLFLVAANVLKRAVKNRCVIL